MILPMFQGLLNRYLSIQMPVGALKWSNTVVAHAYQQFFNEPDFCNHMCYTCILFNIFVNTSNFKKCELGCHRLLFSTQQDIASYSNHLKKDINMIRRMSIILQKSVVIFPIWLKFQFGNPNYLRVVGPIKKILKSIFILIRRIQVLSPKNNIDQTIPLNFIRFAIKLVFLLFIVGQYSLICLNKMCLGLLLAALNLQL
eukprot:TRINITY_DN10826_c1_g1_i2.p1 TRINITY_DN10826_c1_g1~~TRINITY_DN10826_c1_g1_i2.p1  ORF type:complete len:199 (-),score=-16.68 TRINITY_DN10826_c1_g1_i2:631-1227(-)